MIRRASLASLHYRTSLRLQRRRPSLVTYYLALFNHRRARPRRYDFEQLGCRRCHFQIRLRRRLRVAQPPVYLLPSTLSVKSRLKAMRRRKEKSLSRTTIRRKIAPLPKGINGRRQASTGVGVGTSVYQGCQPSKVKKIFVPSFVYGISDLVGNSGRQQLPEIVEEGSGSARALGLVRSPSLPFPIQAGSGSGSGSGSQTIIWRLELIPDEPAIIKSAAAAGRGGSVSLSLAMDRSTALGKDEVDEEGVRCRGTFDCIDYRIQRNRRRNNLHYQRPRSGGGPTLLCVRPGLRFSRSFAADKAHLGPIHITVAVALLLLFLSSRRTE